MAFLATIVVLGVLIFVHELGHFWAAKAVGIGVERFSIGLGPRVLGFRPRDRIPDYVAAFDVAVAPYRDCLVNRSCYPLKVVEALAMAANATTVMKTSPTHQPQYQPQGRQKR